MANSPGEFPDDDLGLPESDPIVDLENPIEVAEVPDASPVDVSPDRETPVAPTRSDDSIFFPEFDRFESPEPIDVAIMDEPVATPNFDRAKRFQDDVMRLWQEEDAAALELAKKEGGQPPAERPKPSILDQMSGKQAPSATNAFGMERVIDDELVRLGITKGEEKDAADRERAAGLLSRFGIGEMSAKEAAEHTVERLKTAKERETYWTGVLNKVVAPMRGAVREPGDIQFSGNPALAPLEMLKGVPWAAATWAEDRVGRNIAEAKREQFFATQALTQPEKQARTGGVRNFFDSTARGALDTGIGKSVAGFGSLVEYGGKAEMAAGMTQMRNAEALKRFGMPVSGKVAEVQGKALVTLGMLDLMKGKAVSAIGDWISGVAVEQFPEDEARQAEWGTLLGNGAGTMAAIWGPSMTATMLVKASPASRAILAAATPEEAAALLAKETAKAKSRAATTTGTVTGAMMQAEGEKQEAEAAQAAGKPVTSDDIAATYFWNILPGASESLPLANLWSAPAGAFVRNVFREAIEEGGQEWAQSVAGNIIAQNYYDPERKWDEGAWEGALVGHILGGTMAAGHQALNREKGAPEGEDGNRLTQEAKVRGGKGGATMTDAGEASPQPSPQTAGQEIGGFPVSGEPLQTDAPPAADEPEFSARIKSKDKSVDDNDLQAYLSMYRGKGEAEEKAARKSLKALDDYAKSREMQWSIENGDIVMRDRHGVAATGAANADAEDLAQMAARDVKSFGRSSNDFMALDNYLADEGLDIAKKSKPSKDQGDFVAKLAETLRGPGKVIADESGNSSPLDLEETERPGEFGVGSYDAFRRVLATNAPAKSWQSRLGVSDDQMKTLVAQAKRDGYVRGKRGKWLRTPAAKTVADGLAGSGKPQAAPAVGETVRFKGNKGIYRIDVTNPDGTVMARRWNSVRKAWAGKAARLQPDAIEGRVGNPDRKAARAQRVEPTLSMPAEAAAELQARPAVPPSKSVTPNYVISLLDGSRHVDLRPHLEKNGLTARQYADRFGLDGDYPLVSPLSRWRDDGDTAADVTIASETAAEPVPETGEFAIEPPANVEMLKGVLESYGVDTSAFGKGSAKTLGHLRRELESGEARLVVKDGALLRRIEAVGVVVYANAGGRRLRLYEAQQTFSDGRTRTRNLSASLAEKMTAAEEPASAALRGVREELGADARLTSEVTTRTERGDSQSYPGLPAEYVLHSVDAEIPEAAFRSSYVENQDDKTTTFGWRDAATSEAVEIPVERGSPEDLERREAAAREIMLTPEYAKAADIDNPVLRTTDIPGYGSDKWKAEREYRDGDVVIKGWRRAVAHLGEKAFDAIPGGPKYERLAFVLIGFPGAGKSSIADQIRRDHGAAHVVADDAKVIIPEYAGGMNSSGVHDESSELNDDVLKYVLATGSNIILEKLGNSDKSVLGMIAAARAGGYQTVSLAYVDVPKAVAMERAISRWRRSGRAVGMPLYDALRADERYAYIKQIEGADGTAHIQWNERDLKWDTVEASGPLQGIVIPDRPQRRGGEVRPGQPDAAVAGEAAGPGTAGVGLEEQGQETGIAGTVERVADERAAETGRDVSPEVVELAERVANVADAGLDVSIPLSGAKLSDEDARDLAAIVGYPSDESSKDEALQTITERAAALKEGIDANRRLLEQAARALPGGQVPGGVQADAAQRGAADSLPAGGRGSEGSGTGSADPDGERAAGAEPGVQGEGGDAGIAAAEGEGDRAEGRDRAAAVDAIEEERAEAAPYNYQITDADEIGKGGPKTKVRGNIEAIRVIRQMEEEGRTLATAEEKAKLVKYVGWGAFAQDVFATHKPEWAKERQQLADLLSAEEMRTARASTTNAHYTSPEVIRGMWDALDHLGVTGWNLRALEPAAGVGHFIGLQPGTVTMKTPGLPAYAGHGSREDTSWTAVELDQISGKITKALYGAADVRVQGYETVNWPNDHFDLAISNVPFAEQGPYDPAYKKSMTLHDYFFVKSLDKVRPGGIVAFITSAGTMDKGSTAVRRALADKATMLGAIRLPGGSKGAFKANAGTDVTTDIIFLRKRVDGEPMGDRSWIETAEIKTPEGPTKINQYFIDNPDMMLGKMRLQGSMYGPGEPVLIGPTDAMQTRIREAAEKMQADAFVPRGQEAGVLAEADIDTETDGIKEGALYEKDGKLFRKVMGVGQPQKYSKGDAGIARSFLEVRDAANALLAAQAGNVSATDMGVLRFDLNEAYDAFVQAHGPLNKTLIRKQKRKDGRTLTIRQKPNMAVFRADPDAYKVAALESYNEETGAAAKAAIFSEDVIEAYERPPIAGPTDALAVSLNETGRVDMAFIAERLGLSEADAAAELGNLVYLNPVGEKWEIAGQYLAGDVVEKLDVARGAAELDSRYSRNVVALTEAQPPRIPREDIAVQFGAQWVPPGVYEDFIREVLGARIKVSLTEQTAEWSVSKGYFPPSAQAQFSTGRADIGRVLADTLNNKRLLISDTVYDPETRSEKSVPNPQATMEANARADALRQAFQDWKYQDEARAQELEDIYNQRFNRLAPETYDGSHLTFPGLARVVSFPDGSKGTINTEGVTGRARTSTIWRIIQKGNTLIDHVVGAGKTWTMIMSGMEQKRLGLIQRPMYVVPNHMLEQFSTEFLQAYPNAKLLVASKDEMTLAKRKEFAGKIAAEKWDGIIITHDAFGRIAMSDAAYREFLTEQIEELEAAKLDADKDDRPTIKSLEKAKKALETKLQKYLAKERKDAGATFEELGVDFLYVDEAHLFKNLGFATKQQRVKGVNAQSQSQRAMDLFVKIRYLEKLRPGRAAVFATGTPISNTMAELFVMQRYLQLPELQRFKIDRFDAWASTFGNIVTKMELAPDGRTFRESSSFSEFVNIPELNAIWSRIADTKTADQLQLPRPTLKNGRPTVIEAEPSEFELEYIQDLIARAEEVKKGNVEPEEDNMLKIVSEGRKIATDGRLIANTRDINPNGKIARAVEEIYSRWQSGKEPALVQMVFLDMGVPGGKSVAKPGAPKKKGKRSEVEEIRDELLAEAGQDQDSDEPNLEASELISGAFDLYADLKQRLIDRGIPSEQIAFIHDAKGDDGKARLFADVKAAKVRVLFGSTPKMGVGTNVQKRLIAMHHLDAPWKPAEVEQRDGRILRQGNLNKEIEILRYVTRASFDSYMWQTLERKANFINQYKSGQRGARRMEDIDNPLPEAAMLKAAASGDPRILEHAELGKTVQSLESARTAHFNAVRSAKTAIANIEKSLASSEKYIVGYESDAALVTDLSGDRFAVDLSEIAPENGANVTERVKAGEAIRAYIAGLPYWSQNGDKYLGTISGFRFGYTTKRTDQGLEATAFIEGAERYTSTAGAAIISETSNPLPLIQRFERLVKDMPLMLKAAQIARDRNSKDLPRLRQQAEGGEFPQQAQLDTAKARVAALEAALRPQEATGEVAPAQEIPEGKVSIEDFASEVAEAKDRLGVRERPKSQLIGDNVEDAEVLPPDSPHTLASIGAWHGSRRRFDTFRTDYVGTGEGAQAFGDGLYFSDNRAVAETYRTAGIPMDDDDTGYLYQVDLNVEPEELFDLDTPLAQQPKAIQNAVRGGLAHRLFGQRFAGPATGSGVTLEELSKSPEFVARLRAAGVKGIRYLDQYSREGRGSGTRNYVIFNARDVVIKNVEGDPVEGDARAVAVAAAQPSDTGWDDIMGSAPAVFAALAPAPALPMDKDSRLARAREMGFDTDTVWYHGTDAAFSAFDPAFRGSVTGSSDSEVAFWFTQDRSRARAAARDAMDSSGVNVPHFPNGIVESYVRLRNPLTVDTPIRDLDPPESAATIKAAEAAGHDGVIFVNGEGNGPDLAVFNPNNIRSVNAAFDPREDGSPMLMAALASDPLADIIRIIRQEAENGRNAEDGRGGSPDGQGGSPAGELAGAGGAAAAGRQTVEVTRNGILAAAQRIFGGAKSEEVEARRKAQRFTVKAWHSTISEPYFAPDGFRRGHDFGFHVAIGSPRAANNRVQYPTSVIDKLTMLAENVSRYFSRGAKPLKQLDNASLMPLYVKAEKSLRMPDIGDWADPENWLEGLNRRNVKAPKGLGAFITSWMASHRYEQRRDQIIYDHEFSSALAGWLERNGYDSVIYKNEIEDSKDSLFVWDPAQVRSAYDTFDERAVGQPGIMASLPYIQDDARERLARLAAESGLDGIVLAALGSQSTDLATLPMDIERGVAALKEGSRLAVIRAGMQKYKTAVDETLALAAKSKNVHIPEDASAAQLEMLRAALTDVIGIIQGRMETNDQLEGTLENLDSDLKNMTWEAFNVLDDLSSEADSVQENINEVKERLEEELGEAYWLTPEERAIEEAGEDVDDPVLLRDTPEQEAEKDAAISRALAMPAYPEGATLVDIFRLDAVDWRAAVDRAKEDLAAAEAEVWDGAGATVEKAIAFDRKAELISTSLTAFMGGRIREMLYEQYTRMDAAITESLEGLTTEFIQPTYSDLMDAESEVDSVLDDVNLMLEERREAGPTAAVASTPSARISIDELLKALREDQDVRASLEADLRRALPPNIAIRIMDRVRHKAFGDNELRGLAQVSGDRSRGSVLISRAFGDDVARRTIRHETIHILRQLGLFLDSEWALLVREARKRSKLLDEAGNDREADYLTNYRRNLSAMGLTGAALDAGVQEYMDQEFVAHFAEIYEEGNVKVGAKTRTLLDRLRDAIQAFLNWRAGNGLMTDAEVTEAGLAEVLGKARSGVIAGRYGGIPLATVDMTAAAIAGWHGGAVAIDRFDSRFMGSGEGAQAFSRGHYIAENRGVAKYYKDTIGVRRATPEQQDALERNNLNAPGFDGWGAGPAVHVDGVLVSDSVDISAMVALQHLMPWGSFKSYDEAISETEKLLAWSYRQAKKYSLFGFMRGKRAREYSAMYQDMAKRDEATLARLKEWRDRGAVLEYRDPPNAENWAPMEFGHLMGVEIMADPENFLEWDKSLFGQSSYVRDALKSAGFRLTSQLGSSIARGNEALLRKAGILGVRYLDNGSRNPTGNASNGTYNYVVYDDDLLLVTSIDGVPVVGGERDKAVDVVMAAVASPQTPPPTAAPKKGYSRPAKGISDLIADVRGTMGLTHRHGRLDPALKRQARAAGGELAGQYSSRTGVIRTALPNDWTSFTHEAGHALERRRGFAGRLDALKIKYAKELMGSPPADVPMPQGGLKADGFSGVELDYEQQALLAEALLAAAKATAPGAASDLTLNEAGMHTVDQLQAEAVKTRQALDNAVGAAVADQLMGLGASISVISRFSSGKGNALRVQTRSDEEIKDQLRAELAQRFSATGTPQTPQAQRFSRMELSEAFAEFFRAFLTNQDAARARAPRFFDAFESDLNATDPGLFDQLDAIHDAYQALQKADPMGMVASRVKSTVREHGIIGQFIADLREKGAKETFSGIWDSISLMAYGAYASYIDSKHPMNVAVKALLEQARSNLTSGLGNDARLMIKAINDPYKRLRLAEHSKSHATAILQHGVILKGSVDPVGPSLWDALEAAFGGTKRGQWNEEIGEQFNAYLAARRMVAEFDRFETTEKEMGDHLTPKETWEAAVVDFEALYPQFKAAAQTLYQFNQNLLTWKLEQGFLTQDVYDELSKRTDYVPLQRIMDDQGFGLTSLKTKNKGSLIKTFKGSNRDIIAPLESIMADVYATTNRVAINNVIRTLDTLARAAGPGGGAIAERLPPKEYKGTRVQMRDILSMAKTVRKAGKRMGFDKIDQQRLIDEQHDDLRDAVYKAAGQSGLSTDEKAELLNTLDMLFDAEASKTIFQLTDTSEKGEPIVWLWENGERVPIRLGDNQVGKDIFQLFVGMGAQNESDVLINLTLGAADLLRAGITRHPGYIVVNYLRDQFSTWMHSSAFTPFVTGGKGLASVLKNDIWAKRYSSYAGLMGPESDVAHRASAAAGYELNPGMQHDPMSLRGKGLFNSPTAWGKFLKGTEATEAGTRVGHFKGLFERFKAEGMTDEEAMFEAAYAAHDVIDFSRRGGGAVAGFGARAVTFLNAAVQDLDSARRTLKGERDELQDLRKLATPYLSTLTGENPLMIGKVSPVVMRNSFKIWVKMASLMTFSLLLAALYADDDEINEIGDDIRATHWIFRDPFTGRIRRVPKPFQYAAIANIGEAAFDRFYHGDERWLQKIWRGLKATFSLPYEPPLVGLFYETKANKDFYSGRPITSGELAALPPEQQFNAYTSEFGRLIGGVMGLSPVQIDHWVAGMFGSLGRDALTMSNFILPRINQATGGAMDSVSKEPRADTSPEDWIMMSRFSRRAARGSLSGTRFWEQMGQEGGKFVQAAAGLKAFAKSGQFREAQQFLDSLDENRRAYALMETFLTEAEQDAHPLHRAEQVMATARGIRKAMVLEKLYRQEDLKGGAVSARESELSRIKVTPKTAMRVNEILEDIAMREARNALIVVGDSGWQRKRVMPVKPLMDELKVVAPEVHEEMVYRMENGSNKVYPFESVAAAWPAMRDAVLRGGMQVDRGDVAGEVGDAETGEDTKDKPYYLSKPDMPGMMRLGGPIAAATAPRHEDGSEITADQQRYIRQQEQLSAGDRSGMIFDDEGDVEYEMDPSMAIEPHMIPQMSRSPAIYEH